MFSNLKNRVRETMAITLIKNENLQRNTSIVAVKTSLNVAVFNIVN